MTPLMTIAFTVCWIGAAISFAFLIGPFFAIAEELRSAREAGLADDIPQARRGLPLTVIVTNALPRVNRERKKFIRALGFFLGFWAAAFAMGVFFVPHH